MLCPVESSRNNRLESPPGPHHVPFFLVAEVAAELGVRSADVLHEGGDGPDGHTSLLLSQWLGEGVGERRFEGSELHSGSPYV